MCCVRVGLVLHHRGFALVLLLCLIDRTPYNYKLELDPKLAEFVGEKYMQRSEVCCRCVCVGGGSDSVCCRRCVTCGCACARAGGEAAVAVLQGQRPAGFQGRK